MLTRRKKRAKSPRKDRRSRSLQLQPLEERTLLTIDSRFDDGQLTVHSSANDDFLLSWSGNVIKVNGADPAPTSIAAGDVRSLRFEGGPESQVIDISKFNRIVFPSVEQFVFDNGPWLKPDSVLQIVEDTLGPGWAEKLRIDSPRDFLVSGAWRDPLNSDALARQLTAAGWGDSRGLLKRITDESAAHAAVYSQRIGPQDTRPDYDVLFNGQRRLDAVAAPGDEPLASPFFGGDEGNDPMIYISGPAAQTEGNSGTTNVVFNVSVSDSTGSVTFTWETVDITATSADYVPGSGSGTVPQGGSAQITVAIKGDTIDELDETFKVRLTSASVAFGTSEAAATILDDDAPTTSISIANASLTEPEIDGDTANMSFVVSLSEASAAPVTFNWRTASIAGQAVSPDDYTAVPTTGPITIPAGQTSTTVLVSVRGDDLYESNETFNVILSDITHANNGNLTAVGTIINSDPPATTIDVSGASLLEPTGPGDVANMLFTVSLTTATTQSVSFVWQTQAIAGQATAGTDYTAVSATTVTFAPSETTKTLTVPIKGDLIDELDETLQVVLSNITNATAGVLIGTGTIVDSDATPLIDVADTSVAEDVASGTVTVNLSLDHASSQNIVVNWATSDGTAVHNEDFDAASGSVTFLPGETSKSLPTMVLHDDTTPESDETFFVFLSNVNPYGKIGVGQATVTIIDNDPSTVVVDDQAKFVPENSLYGTTVGFVDVTQNLAPDAAPVQYVVTGGTGAAIFAVNDSTGEITVINSSSLNYEALHTFTLNISVNDPASGTTYDTAVITVNVTDINEPPHFLSHHNTATFAENATTPQALMIAIDPETADSRSVEIIAGDDDGLFAPFWGGVYNWVTVRMATGKTLDYETKSVYTLTIKITDGGGNSDVAELRILVSDVNEPPQISPQEFELPENSPIGTLVGTVTSINDASDTSITYSISDPGNAAGIFDVDSAGRITVLDNSALDYENSPPTYHLIVSVTDGVTTPQTAEVTIHVSDVNEPPIVTPATFTIDENSPHGTLVGTPIQFTDPDAGSVTLSITAGNDTPIGTGVFAFDPVTRQLYVADSHQLNYELKQSYQLAVQAHDNGTGQLTDVKIITVNVNDKDEAPEVQGGVYSISVPAAPDSIDGVFAGQVHVQDPDASDFYGDGGNGQSSWGFSITSGNIGTAPNEALEISDAGVITVNNTAALRTAMGQTLTLTVRVTDDDDSNNLFATANVTLIVSATAAPPTITLTATLRDFHSSGFIPTSPTDSQPHPDFQRDLNPFAVYTGLVKSTLGVDGKPVFSGIATPGSVAPIKDAASFSSWYNDNSVYNRTTATNLTFTRQQTVDPTTGSNVTAYWSVNPTFFPLDNQLFDVPGGMHQTADDEDEYLSGGPDGDGLQHNFHFTMEIHATFTYRKGTNQLFKLTKSDDDLWLFINQQLVVDIGGIHAPANGVVNLDAISGAVGPDGRTNIPT